MSYGSAAAHRAALRSRLELFDRLNAATADGWMLGVLADVGFPMPATFAFLAIGFGNSYIFYQFSISDDF